MTFRPFPKTYTEPKSAKPLSKTSQADRGKLIRRLDDLHSKFIRNRAKSPLAGNKVRCFTCGRLIAYSIAQCSHYIHRETMATRFDPINCQASCWDCNILKGGNLDEFKKNLLKSYGQKELDRLESLRHSVVKFSVDELQEMIKKYR